MRKLIFIIAFLITSFAFAQGGPKVDVVKFRGEVSTAVRNGFTVPANEYWLIYNTTTDLMEIGSSSGWVTVGDGIQEGANTIPTGISLNQGITNTIQILPDLNGNPSLRLIGGNQDDATFQIITDDKVVFTFATGFEDYEINALGETNPNDLTRKSYVDALASSGANLSSTNQTIGVDVQRNITTTAGGSGQSALNLVNPSGVQMALTSLGISFTSPPSTGVLPTISGHLTNKAYVDGLDHTDDQTFDVAQISGDILELSLDNVAGLTSIDISSADNQTLSLGGSENASVTISGGNTVSLNESIQDVLGSMVIGNTETGITVNYDDVGGKLDFEVDVSTLQGDLTQVSTDLSNAETVGNTNSARLDSVVTVLGSATASAFEFNTQTANYTAVAADANDNKIVFLDYDNEDFTIPSGVFNEGQSIRVQSIGAGVANIVAGANVDFTPFDKFVLDSVSKAITIVRTNNVSPELWFPLDGYIKNGSNLVTVENQSNVNTELNINVTSSFPPDNSATGFMASNSAYPNLNATSTALADTSNGTGATYVERATPADAAGRVRFRKESLTANDIYHFDLRYRTTTTSRIAFIGEVGAVNDTLISDGEWHTYSKDITISVNLIQADIYADETGSNSVFDYLLSVKLKN